MAEWVGQWWHRAVTRAADKRHLGAAVTLAQMQRPIALLHRAAGGDPARRVASVSARAHGGARDWLQRVAGSGLRADTPRLEPQVLALPEQIAVFADAALNRDLYLWLAAVSAHHDATGDWVGDNLRAAARTLCAFPGLADLHARLLDASLALRAPATRLRGRALAAETVVRLALAAQRDGGDLHSADVLPHEVAPVWPWLEFSAPVDASASTRRDVEPRPGGTEAPADTRRRRARRVQEAADKNAMLMFFRAESLLTWGEFIKVNRDGDDDETADPAAPANDMDELAVAEGGAQCAARVRFDLDLPSAAMDDLPVGDGACLPEWDFKRQLLQPGHCAVQVLCARDPAPFEPAPELRRLARRVRRRMEPWLAAPLRERGHEDGDELDLDAWVRHAGEAPAVRDGTSPRVWTRTRRIERSLATLLLADLSLSTEAHVPGVDRRVIDVVRDALFVFGEALAASGDAFEMQGFSSVKRQHVRMQQLKTFDEAWGAPVQARVGAIKPGFYTRMGAALRHATARLAERPERQRLLLLLTDGKPNDLDAYEGRYGLEDTRHAVQAARAAGLVPFAVTIDENGHDWLPHLFGARGYALVHRPRELAARLPQIFAALTRG